MITRAVTQAEKQNVRFEIKQLKKRRAFLENEKEHILRNRAIASKKELEWLKNVDSEIKDLTLDIRKGRARLGKRAIEPSVDELFVRGAFIVAISTFAIAVIDNLIKTFFF